MLSFSNFRNLFYYHTAKKSVVVFDLLEEIRNWYIGWRGAVACRSVCPWGVAAQMERSRFEFPKCIFVTCTVWVSLSELRLPVGATLAPTRISLSQPRLRISGEVEYSQPYIQIDVFVILLLHFVFLFISLTTSSNL